MPRSQSSPWLYRSAVGVTFAYVALLSYLLLIPDPYSIFGSVAGDFSADVQVTLSAYTQHVLAYCVLTSLLFWTTVLGGGSATKVCILVAGSHAMLTEFLQRYVPRRHGDLWDLACDFVGIAIVLASAAIGSTLQRSLIEEPVRPS